MIEIINENFDELVAKSVIPVVLDFWAPWCGPCKAIAPYIEELSEKYKGKVLVAKVNIDDSGDLAMKFGIRNIPTVIFLKNGEVKEKIVGAVSKDKYSSVVDSLL